jgi:predicted alpha/beta-hydrolase family hydrolase
VNDKTAIILAHGAGAGIQTPFMRYFRNELEARGFVSLQFNFDYIEAGRKVPDPQPKLQARYRSAVEEALAEHSPKNVFIGGKSMGGRVASYIAGDTPGVTGLIFLGYPLHPPGRQDQMRDKHLYDLKLPMLFISGTRDTFAERGLLERVVERLGNRAVLMWIEGGDHSLTVKRGDTAPLRMAADRIEEWINYLAGLK